MVTYVYGYSQDGPQGIILEDRIELLFHLPPGVQFCFGDWDPFLDTVVVPAERVEVICNHPNRALFAKIEQWIRRKTVIAQSVHVEMVLYPQLMKNLLPNFLHIDGSFDIGLWKNAFSGVPAVVCGAGPSLEELHMPENGALVLAGGSAIAALKTIKPHLLFAIDPNEEEYRRLATHPHKEVPLVFGSRLERRVLAEHKGPRGYLVTGTGGYLESWLEQEAGITDHGVLQGLSKEALSVTSLTLMAACYFGCNPIMLAGVDLSFLDGKRYANGIEGSEIDKKAMEQKWDMERDVLDAITQLYPDRTFLKVSDRGRPFKHIPYRPYTFTPHAIDLHPLIKKTKRSVNVEPHLQRFHESLGRCKQILAEPKTLLSDFELQEELAFKLAVEPLMAGLAYRQENDLYKAALAMLE